MKLNIMFGKSTNQLMDTMFPLKQQTEPAFYRDLFYDNYFLCTVNDVTEKVKALVATLKTVQQIKKKKLTSLE